MTFDAFKQEFDSTIGQMTTDQLQSAIKEAGLSSEEEPRKSPVVTLASYFGMPPDSFSKTLEADRLAHKQEWDEVQARIQAKIDSMPDAELMASLRRVGCKFIGDSESVEPTVEHNS